jgi:hypothetical protein
MKSLCEKIQKLESQVLAMNSGTDPEAEEHIINVYFVVNRGGRSDGAYPLRFIQSRATSYAELIRQIRSYYISNGVDIHHRMTIDNAISHTPVTRHNWRSMRHIKCNIYLNEPLDQLPEAKNGG